MGVTSFFWKLCPPILRILYPSSPNPNYCHSIAAYKTFIFIELIPVPQFYYLFVLAQNLFYGKFLWQSKLETKFLTRLLVALEHVEVNSNRFEISLWGKISLRCEVTSLSVFTWLRAKWNSLRCKFHFGQFDRSEISNRSKFSV